MIDGEAKDRVVARMRGQYEQLAGKQPDAKASRAIEQKATASLERVANRQERWSPSGRGRR